MASMNRNPNDDPLNPLTVARNLLAWCLGVIFALALAWTWFAYWYESTRGDHGDGYDVAAAVADRVMPSALLIVIVAILIVTVGDLIGGFAVVTARYLGNKFVKPLIEKRREEGREEGRAEGKAEGRVEGRAEERLLWSEWNRRREAAEADGVQFSEPPPDRAENNGANGMG